ncbi:MAG: transketolase [Solirubrobacteraceae bacterium]
MNPPPPSPAARGAVISGPATRDRSGRSLRAVPGASAAELDRLCVDTIRTLAIDAVEAAGSGHPGLPMAMAPVAYVLYTQVLRHHPHDPGWPDRDRFVLSAGHGSMLLYAALHLCGYDLSLDDLRGFRRWGSRTPGHPERHRAGAIRGIETTTGPLGQGFANAVGMAIAERFLRERYGADVCDHRVFTLCSDGDLMEGVCAEAASLAGHLRLGRLICLYDDNRITIDGDTELAFAGEDVEARFRAYGWRVSAVQDANDLAAVEAALRDACADDRRPSLIRIRSIIGYPAPTKQGTAGAHGAALGEPEARATKQALGWDPDRSFHVPDEVYARFAATVVRGTRLEAEWRARFEAWRARDPARAAEWRRAWSGRPEPGLAAALPRFEAAPETKLATRAAGGQTMQALAGFAPTMVGGSADLTDSVKTTFETERAYSPVAAGRNVFWGVREHAMAAAVNGLALHGGIVRPYGSTFLVFSDYMRPAVRLSALMGLPVAWVFSHDSLGLGEDGPTHQPVEQLASLRAIPGLTVIRPADAAETAEAWRVILEELDGPACLVLTRQAVPVLERDRLGGAGGLARGAYVLAGGGEPAEAVLVASGSEVAVALAAREALGADGLSTRVVSMPSWELFAAQDAGYREAVLPADLPSVSIEAAATMGWERWVDRAVGVDRFGASAPGTEVLARLGVTADAAADAIRQLLGEPPTRRGEPPGSGRRRPPSRGSPPARAPRRSGPGPASGPA